MGAYRTVLLTNRQYIFERAAEGERVLVSINADSAPYTAHFDAGCGRAVDLITGALHDFGGGSQLPPYSAAYWKWKNRFSVLCGAYSPTLWALRGLRPRTPGYFLCGQKVTKKPHRGGTLSMGSLPYVPLPHDDTKGARPLWIPPCIAASPTRGQNGPGGAAPRQTSAAFAEEEGGAAERVPPAACGRMRMRSLCRRGRQPKYRR